VTVFIVVYFFGGAVVAEPFMVATKCWKSCPNLDLKDKGALVITQRHNTGITKQKMTEKKQEMTAHAVTPQPREDEAGNDIRIPTPCSL
jgi:hypothetical protein